MALLGVNIDHIASVRQLRRGTLPDPVEAARICAQAGADSIVAHLREDRRHINDADVARLRTALRALRSKFNLEMSIAEGIVKVALKVKPDQATLVPEKREELTTEGGLDVIIHARRIQQVTQRLEKSGIAVSLFIDPDKRQISTAQAIGTKRIELHTGAYANAANAQEAKKRLGELAEAARFSRSIGLEVYAGHGLDYRNVKLFSSIKEIVEYNIGYSIICASLYQGLGQAVKQMKNLVKNYGRA